MGRALLVGCSLKGCGYGLETAESPVVAVSVAVHVHFLGRLKRRWRRKTKNPRSGGRPGVRENVSGGGPVFSGACGVSGAPVAKPVAIKSRLAGSRRPQRKLTAGTGCTTGQGQHGNLHKETRPYCSRAFAFKPPGALFRRTRAGADRAGVQRLSTSRKRGVALSSTRRLAKSNRLRSASCEGTTFCSARNMISVRPGD